VSLSQITGASLAAGVLTLDEGGGTYRLTFALPDSFGKDHFALFADGTGIGITLSAAPLAAAVSAAARVGLVNEVIARSPWTSFATAVTL
jgi:hypothetical protein